MAKKRKKAGRKASRSGRRGRRVSGIGMAGIPMEALGGMAGFVAAKTLNGVTRKIKIVQEKPILLALAKIGIGYYMNASAKEGFVKNMGLGVIIQGGSDALEVLAPNVFKQNAAAPAVEGIGAVIDLDDDGLSGYDNMDVEHTVAGGEFGYDEISGAI